jgi:membrane protein DedA with SNARE-associated domain
VAGVSDDEAIQAVPDDAAEPAESTESAQSDVGVVSAPAPRTGPFWVVAFVGLVVCTNIAAASWAALEVDHPAKLLMLSSRNRYLVITVPSGISPVTWALVGSLRLLAAAVVCHMVGRCYGDRALRWFWRFLGMPQQQVARFEAQVARAEWFVVPFFVGSNIVWALTGAASTTWKRLAPMFAIGVTIRLALIWWLARTFEAPLRDVIEWTNRYQLWIIGISIVVVVVANVRNFRQGR